MSPSPPSRLRVVTYNIHKCRGLDQRTSPERIAGVIAEMEPDIVCLQEVVHSQASPAFDQARRLAAAFPGFAWSFGSNRPLHGGDYGNMTLSRLPIAASSNLDITKPGREPRGVLHTPIHLAVPLPQPSPLPPASENGRGTEPPPASLRPASPLRHATGLPPQPPTLHLFNAHLGTGFIERRFQAGLLLGERVLSQPGLSGPRLVLGDFNEWTAGLTTRLLKESFASFQPRHAIRFPRTFPGVLPVLTLDHCFYEPPLELVATQLWRTRNALLASDHLPLIADFRWPLAA